MKGNNRTSIKIKQTGFVARLTAVFSLVTLIGCLQPVFAQVTISALVDHFDTLQFGSTAPDGMTYIPALDHFAIVDNQDDKIYIVNRLGKLQSEIVISAFSNFASGIGYDSNLNRFIVTDDVEDEVFIVNPTSGALEDNFDTAVLGCNNPQGITFDPGTGFYVIVDATVDGVCFVDPSNPGVLNSSCLINSFSTSPTGIAYVPSTGDFAVSDNSADEVFIINASCIQQDRFDTGFVTSNPRGIAVDGSTDDYVVVHNNEAFFLNADGSFTTSFGTVVFGSTSPSGITLDASTGNYAIVDNVADEVFFVNASGGLQTQCDTSSFSTNPTGIGYHAATGNFAITDNSADEVFIIDSTCTLLSQFDTATFGILSLNPTGISYISDKGRFGLVDASADAILMIDPVLLDRLSGQRSTSALGSILPNGLDEVAGVGFANVDSSIDEVYVMTENGRLYARFDTSLFSTTPTGIDYNPESGTFAITDSGNDQVFFVEMPGLFPPSPPLCSGDFDEDGDVDGSDLGKFSANFGRNNCPAP